MRLATLLLTGALERDVEHAAEALAEAIRPEAEAQDVKLLGPAPQAPAPLRGKYRWHLLLKGTSAISSPIGVRAET